MTTRFDLEHPQTNGNEFLMERLRARIARRPGRWRRRMRRHRERRDHGADFETEQQAA